MSKDALIEAAWPAQAVEDSNLTVQIAAARRVFQDLAGGADWIETLPRRGYRIPVGGAASHAKRNPLPSRRGAAIARQAVGRGSSFSNLSGDPEQDYFADGMVDDIVTGLSRINWLFVIARNSTFAYKGRAVDVKQVGRELGVRYVVEGSVRKADRRVRVTGQMIDASTGAHVWADASTATPTNVRASGRHRVVRRRRDGASCDAPKSTGEAKAPRQSRRLRSRAAGPADVDSGMPDR